MIGERVTKHRRLLLLLLLLSPSILFGADYVVNSVAYPNRTVHLTATSSDPNYNVTMAMSYPSYIVTGQQVNVNLTLKLGFSSPYNSIGIDGVTAELRDPSRINRTTNVVEEWQTLSSRTTPVATNYTSSGTFTRTISVPATNPPSGNPLDLFVPTTKVAVNGASDLTLYSTAPDNTTAASAVSLSYLDGQTIYQTQLSAMRSTTSLFLYQLIAALLVSLFFLRMRSITAASVGPGERGYSAKLENFMLQRNLAQVENLRNSGRINESGYKELKQKYEEKLSRLKTDEKPIS